MQRKNYIIPKVDLDIVVLSYNHERFIEKNILSFLNQKTNYHFNVLIADDCSTDATREIVKEIAARDKRVFLIENETNLGSIENARNVVNLCTSDYLAFCEGDDFWLDEEKIQTQLDYLKAHPNCGMVHGDVSYFNERTNTLSESVNEIKGVEFPSGQIFEEYLVSDKLFIFTATVMVKRDLFLRSADYDLFREMNWMAQDLPTWLELSQQTEMAYMHKVFAAYRLADESASRSKNPMYLHRFHQSIFSIRYYYWELYSKDPALKTRLDYLYSLSLLADLRILNSKVIWKTLKALLADGDFHWSVKRWLQYIFLSIKVIFKTK